MIRICPFIKKNCGAPEKIAVCLDKGSLKNRSLKTTSNIHQPSDKLRQGGSIENLEETANFLSFRGIGFIPKIDMEHTFLLPAGVNDALRAFPSPFKMKIIKIENFVDDVGKSILHLIAVKNEKKC